MRKISGYAHGSTRVFVPKSFGNDGDPEPVKIHIKQPTEGARREANLQMKGAVAISTKSGMPVLDDAGNMKLSFDMGTDRERQRRLLDLAVAKVENYTDSAGNAIETAAQLWEHGETEIVQEVQLEILRGLSGMGAEGKKG